MKKIYLPILGLVILVGIISLTGYYFSAKSETEIKARPELQCQTAKMTYYYRPECSWCQRIDREGTIANIKELGVEVKETHTRTGAVPRFLINNEIYTGYRTFEQLKELLGC